MALIFRADDALCTGTIISVNVVLTAAHCVVDEHTNTIMPASAFAVKIGSTTISNTQPGQVSAVSRVVMDPLYSPSYHTNDAALLALAGSVSGGFVPLAGASDLSLLTAGNGGAIYGWGIDTQGYPDPSDGLRYGSLVVQSPSYCSSHAYTMGSTFSSSTQFCAVDPNGIYSGCQGDSGGPLVTLRPDHTLAQIGITSWGAANCTPSQPSYFSRVDTISSWAASWVTALAPPPPPAPAVVPPTTPAPTPAAPAPPPAATPSATPATPTPVFKTGKTYTARDGRYRYASVTLATDGKHVLRLRLKTRMSCPRARHTTVDHMWLAPSPGTWKVSRTSALSLTLGQPARPDWYAESDRFRLTGSGNELELNFTTSLRSRRGTPGLCRSGPVTLALS
jgi:hypothetical protein